MFGDFQCPFCLGAQSVLRRVHERLGDRLVFAFRHLPIPERHPLAPLAAEASEAAAAQGKFWEYHDALFAAQPKLSRETMLAVGRELGLDAERMAAEIDSGAHRPRVERDIASAAASGATGTPELLRQRQAPLRRLRRLLAGRGARSAAPADGALRALVQRVSQAAVDVEGERVAQIGPGMLVLLGVGAGDTEAEADRFADKVRALRIFDDAEGRMNEPLGEREVLCVSQFTLYGDARKGNRPSYVDGGAGPRMPSRSTTASASGWSAKKGVFGACMGVALVNDGPVTLMLEVEASELGEEEGPGRA